MPINIITQFAKPASVELALPVKQSGMAVTVEAGTFRINGVKHTLSENQTFTATERAEVAYIDARLVEYEGEVFVLVDEAVADSGEDLETFDWEGSPYTVLWALFWFKVPAGTTTLDGVPINVLRVEAPPQPAVEEEEDDD